MKLRILFLIFVLLSVWISVLAQDDYYRKKSENYTREAEYYQKKAEGYRREAEYYLSSMHVFSFL